MVFPSKLGQEFCTVTYKKRSLVTAFSSFKLLILLHMSHIKSLVCESSFPFPGDLAIRLSIAAEHVFDASNVFSNASPIHVPTL